MRPLQCASMVVERRERDGPTRVSNAADVLSATTVFRRRLAVSATSTVLAGQQWSLALHRLWVDCLRVDYFLEREAGIGEYAVCSRA